MWNQHRGRHLPDSFTVGPTAVAELDWLSSELRLSRWAPTTRRSYNVWLRTWFSFCEVNGVVPLPACPEWLRRFFTWLALHYSISAVNSAASAIVAAHSHHGLPHPYKDEHSLQDLISAIKKSGMCGTRAEKFVVDSRFVVDMCRKFLEWFPVFDKDSFDLHTQPTSDAGRTVLWLRAVAIVLLGLEAGLRCNEVVCLSVCCWVYVDGGDVELHVKLAKNGNMLKSVTRLVRATGSFAENFSVIAFFEEFYIPFLRSAGCGVAAECTHSQFPRAFCMKCSPMFPTWSSRHGQGSISNSTVSEAVKKWAVVLGRGAKNYSAISFRRGSVSEAAASKVDRELRKHHVRHRTLNMQDTYTEMSVEHKRAVGKALRVSVLRSRDNKGKQVEFKC